MDRYDIERIVLDHLRAAADAPVAALTSDLPLGSSGVCADLAVLADEFIGFAIRGSGEPLGDAERTMAAYARCFDRVALVVAPIHVAALRSAVLGGAALWTIDANGRLVEHAPGQRNIVGVSGMLDLLSIADRRALLRPLIPQGTAYDRINPPISPAQVRAYVERTFARDHAATAALLWAA